ncbi:MAG: hypothetical protein HC862_25205 [Scytonema sp. RU_4_4]|nr:hypothetical protein [Scytonema sp. RU_4_4]NJR73897.1 hypothetical protein [Scytonema sp. CRU_2_7]
MGLGSRINRVIKANLNDIAGHFNGTEGAIFIGGGGVAGAGISATVGNMGLAGMGTAVGIYAPHLIAAGAVAGVAAYGVKKGLDNQDPIAVGAGTFGAIAGAAVHATVGNMGLAACGTAVGIYAGHVIAAGSVIGLSVYGLSRLLDSNEIDNSKIETLNRVKLSIQQSIDSAKASKERLESQCKQAENEAQVWHKIAKQVLEQGRLDLAVGALHRWNAYQQTAKSLKTQISELTKVITNLRNDLMVLSTIISCCTS